MDGSRDQEDAGRTMASLSRSSVSVYFTVDPGKFASRHGEDEGER
jgi:hypothetical protein